MKRTRHVPAIREETAEERGGILRGIAMSALVGILLVLALRLTMTETIREPLGRKVAEVSAELAGKKLDVKVVGPTVTVWLAVIVAGLAAVAMGLAAATKSLSWQRLGRFALLAAIVTLAMVSTWHASNRFASLIGTADLAMALLAGFAVAVLCDSRLLGDRGRRIVLAALVAIAAAWLAKGFYQRFVEYPDTLKFFMENREEQLKAHGVDPNDSYFVELFESRLKGMLVTGFFPLSNVFAAGMVGVLTVLAGLVAASFAERPAEKRDEKADAAGEVPVKLLMQVLGCVLLAAGIVVALLTRSRGGAFMAIACPIAVGLGVFFRETVFRWRRVIITLAIVGAVLGAGAVAGWGLARDQSLSFRRDYWAGAAKLTQQSPALGVGLNNFGEWYGTVKRPSSPEDVTDPHSFFVRLASELGIPATVLVAGLLAWVMIAALRRADAPEATDAKPPTPVLKLALTGVVLAFTWWILHFYLAEAALDVNLLLSAIYAIVATGGGMLAIGLLEEISPRGMRMIGLAALIGALGMLAYDQINMALVTGPVAMLFWILLGLAESHERGNAAPAKIGVVPTAVTAGGAVALAALVAIPLVEGQMAWDPAPWEYKYIREAGRSPVEALAALEQAAVRSPRSLDILRAKIELKRHLKQGIEEEIRKVLSLDRANARVRIYLGRMESGLRPKERADILREGLKLDEELPAGEMKRLPAKTREEVENLIRELDFLATRPQ